MQRFILFTLLFIWVAAFVTFMLRRNRKKTEVVIEDFVERERSANSARRKEIDESLFFTADLSKLPKVDVDNPAYRKVAEASARKMLHFKQPMNNTDLKMSYGPSQIEDIAQYEENFQEFIRALIFWAEELLKAGLKEDALRVIEYSLESGSDFKRSFSLAADIFESGNNEEKLNGLLNRAESAAFADESIKRSVIKYIMDAKAGLR